MSKVLVEVLFLDKKVRLCEGIIVDGLTRSAIDRMVILPLIDNRSFVGLYVSHEQGRVFPEAEYYCVNVSPISPLHWGFHIPREDMGRLYAFTDSNFELRKEFRDLQILKTKP